MNKASSWILQYSTVVLLAVFAGPLLSTLPMAQSLPLSLFGLDRQQTIRLLTSGLGLILCYLVALSIYRQIPDNRRGASFLRQLILPVTTLLMVLVIDKTLRATGLTLSERFPTAHYHLLYAGALIGTGLWTTTAWWLSLDALHRYFSQPTPVARRKDAPPVAPTPHSEDDQEEPDTTSSTLPTQSNTLTVLGRYKVLKELGRGSMGVVYLGKDPTIQRLVAIKTMRLDEIDETDKLQEIKTRFFQEAESTGRLSHPNIVTIFDAGEQHGLGYIAIELLQGTTLKHWSRKPNLLPVERVISIIATVADAMDYAHQQGVVHRDIKPANIMLTNDDIVKVMDFGIAKMATSSKTQTNIVMGTPTYMSPEQIAGKKVDGRSDIFSLAVVMFELLTGRPPFMADNVSALLFAIAQTPHPSLTAIRPDVPPGIKVVMDRALHKDPVHRYRRASEFAMELRSSLQGLAA